MKTPSPMEAPLLPPEDPTEAISRMRMMPQNPVPMVLRRTKRPALSLLRANIIIARMSTRMMMAMKRMVTTTALESLLANLLRANVCSEDGGGLTLWLVSCIPSRGNCCG